MINHFCNLPRIFLSIIFILLFSSATIPDKELSNEVFRYTNEFRRSKGMPALIMKEDLNSIARKHSENMASGRCSFGHAGFNQRSAKVKTIYKICTIAENVAYGAKNAKEVISLWKNSSVHRKNMLGKYKYTGIGVAKSKRGVIYYTEIFVN